MMMMQMWMISLQWKPSLCLKRGLVMQMIIVVDNSYGAGDAWGCECDTPPGDGCCKLPPRTKQLNSHLSKLISIW